MVIETLVSQGTVMPHRWGKETLKFGLSNELIRVNFHRGEITKLMFRCDQGLTLDVSFDYHFTVDIIPLLHIMCGYQCDKAVNKNDTRAVI